MEVSRPLLPGQRLAVWPYILPVLSDFSVQQRVRTLRDQPFPSFLINIPVNGWQTLRNLATQQGETLSSQYLLSLVKIQGVRINHYLLLKV